MVLTLKKIQDRSKKNAIRSYLTWLYLIIFDSTIYWLNHEILLQEDNFPELLSGGFLNPNDISLEFIQVSISFSSCLGKRSLTSGLRTNSLPYQFEWSLCIEHNDNPLQLRCIGLRVRYEVCLYQDSEGRPNKLSIVVDIPENLRQVLEFCDEIAEITFRKFGSNSEWRQVIKEYGNRPSVRLKWVTLLSDSFKM